MDPARPRSPLAFLAVAVGLGYVADVALPIGTSWWIGLAALFVVASGLLLRRAGSGWLILATALLLGGAWHHLRTAEVSPDDVVHFTDADRRLAHIRGTIAGEVVRLEQAPSDVILAAPREERTRFDLQDLSLRSGGDWVTADGRMSVTVRGAVEGVVAGDRVEVVGWLRRPSGPMNPGEFDYARYLEGRGIRAVLFSETERGVARLPEPSQWTLSHWREEGRRWASHALRERLSPTAARLADSLLLGIRTSLPPNELEPFLESGTIHVLVVSGLHVGLMAWLAWLALRVLPLGLKGRALATIGVIVLYTYFSGSNPPAVRAAVLASILFGEYLFSRTGEPVNSLSLSALVVMLLDPGDLFRPGPQLSFLCAFAILVFLPRLRPRMPADWGGFRQPMGWAADLALVSAVLWLVTAPLVSQQFHLLAPVSVLASMALVPLTTIALGVGTLFFPFASVPIVGAVLGGLLEVLLWMTSAVSNWGASLETVSRYVPGPDAYWTLAWYLLLIGPWLCPVIRPLGRGHMAAMTLAFLIGVGLELRPSGPGAFEYHQLAVGHGNSAVVRTARGRTMLIDAGSVSGPAVGERVIAPFLWYERLRAIDTVVLSHADIDHFNAFGRLARRFAIGEVVCPRSLVMSPEPAVAVLMEELRAREIPLRFVGRGDVLRFDEVTIEVLHPPKGFTGENDNAQSLVARIEFPGGAILSTGDIEADGLRDLLALPPARSDILIVPHHGAASSSSAELAAWVHPQIAISSEGYERRRTDTMAPYRAMGARILTTHDDGWIRIRAAAPTFAVTTWRDLAGRSPDD